MSCGRSLAEVRCQEPCCVSEMVTWPAREKGYKRQHVAVIGLEVGILEPGSEGALASAGKCLDMLSALLPAAEAQCKPYYSDYSRFRLLIHQMCTSHYLDLFITGVIGLNVITMAMEHYQQPKVLAQRKASSGRLCWSALKGRVNARFGVGLQGCPSLCPTCPFALLSDPVECPRAGSWAKPWLSVPEPGCSSSF